MLQGGRQLESDEKLTGALAARAAGVMMHFARAKGRETNEPSSVCRRVSPKAGEEREEVAVFEMTGKTGSYFYMAPEVVNEQPYNEKASF